MARALLRMGATFWRYTAGYVPRVSLYRQPNLFWCLYIIYSYINTRVYHIDVFDDLGEIILSEGVFWGALLLLTFG
jgi:hypothetical protein